MPHCISNNLLANMLSDYSVCCVNQYVFVTGSAQKCPSHWSVCCVNQCVFVTGSAQKCQSHWSVCCLNQCVFVSGSAQKCPSHWYGFAAPGKCYRFVDTNFLSYDDARGFCQIHGGDILRIDSTRERVFSLLIIHHLSLVTNYTQLM